MGIAFGVKPEQPEKMSPTPPGFGLYSQLQLVTTDQPIQYVANVHNGKISWKFDGNFEFDGGKMNILTFFSDDESESDIDWEEIHEDVSKAYDKYVTKHFTFADTGHIDPNTLKSTHLMDEFIPTEEIINSNEGKFYFQDGCLRIGWDKFWFIRNLGHFQTKLSKLEKRTRHAVPEQMIVGLGIAIPKGKTGGKETSQDGLKFIRRPTDMWRFAEKTAVGISPIKIDKPNKEFVRRIFWTKIGGRAIKEFMTMDGNAGIEGYTDADYEAVFTYWLYGNSGTGTIPLETQFSATDILDRVMKNIGVGWTKANKFCFGLDGDLTFTYKVYEAYFKMCIITGFALARISAFVDEWEVSKLVGFKYQVKEIADNSFTCDSEFGSRSDFYLPMPRNYTTRKVQEVPVLCCVSRHDEEATEKQILKTANVLRPRIPLREPIGSATVITVDRGETMLPVIAKTDHKRNVFQLKAGADARQWEEEVDERNLVMIEFDLTHLVTSTSKLPKRWQFTENWKKTAWWLGMFSNCETVQSQGFNIKYGLGLLTSGKVKRQETLLGTSIMKVEDSGHGDKPRRGNQGPTGIPIVENHENNRTSDLPPTIVDKYKPEHIPGVAIEAGTPEDDKVSNDNDINQGLTEKDGLRNEGKETKTIDDPPDVESKADKEARGEET